MSAPSPGCLGGTEGLTASRHLRSGIWAAFRQPRAAARPMYAVAHCRDRDGAGCFCYPPGKVLGCHVCRMHGLQQCALLLGTWHMYSAQAPCPTAILSHSSTPGVTLAAMCSREEVDFLPWDGRQPPDASAGGASAWGSLLTEQFSLHSTVGGRRMLQRYVGERSDICLGTCAGAVQPCRQDMTGSEAVAAFARHTFQPVEVAALPPQPAMRQRLQSAPCMGLGASQERQAAVSCHRS